MYLQLISSSYFNTNNAFSWYKALKKICPCVMALVAWYLFPFQGLTMTPWYAKCKFRSLASGTLVVVVMECYLTLCQALLLVSFIKIRYSSVLLLLASLFRSII